MALAVLTTNTDVTDRPSGLHTRIVALSSSSQTASSIRYPLSQPALQVVARLALTARGRLASVLTCPLLFAVGSGGGLSPNLAALLSANPLNRDGSMDWMAWPPSPPTATTNAPQHTDQAQPSHTRDGEAYVQQGAAALDLDGAPSVNHWLPSADTMVGHNPSAAAAAPAAGSGAAGAGAVRLESASVAPGGATSPLLQGQDQLQLHQIHIGGEPLFHSALTAPYSLPYNTGLGATGETKLFDTLPDAGCSLKHCMACILAGG